MKKRILSFKYAFQGIFLFVKDEAHAKVHIGFALLAVILGIFLKIKLFEWTMVLLLIGLVVSAEIINSAIESLADFVSPDKHQLIKKVKDLSAAAVLFIAIIALVIGILIFLPKILQLWK